MLAFLNPLLHVTKAGKGILIMRNYKNVHSGHGHGVFWRNCLKKMYAKSPCSTTAQVCQLRNVPIFHPSTQYSGASHKAYLDCWSAFLWLHNWKCKLKPCDEVISWWALQLDWSRQGMFTLIDLCGIILEEYSQCVWMYMEKCFCKICFWCTPLFNYIIFTI